MTAPWPLTRSLAKGKVLYGLFPPEACTVSWGLTRCGKRATLGFS